MTTKLYMDIETCPDEREGAYEEILANIKPPANYRKQETIDKWIAEQGVVAAQEQYHKTGLHGISGGIISIAWALEDGEVHSILRRPDSTEEWLLQNFMDQVMDEAESLSADGWPRLQWVGHNIIGFDLRFLQQRLWINKVKAKFVIPVDARHGDWVFDTMLAWGGWKGYVSQDALAKALGLEGKGDVTGADVWPLYQKGEYDVIETYNRSDVSTVRAIHQRLTI